MDEPAPPLPCGPVPGAHVAAALWGAWRKEVTPLTLSAEALARLVPRFLEKGEAGLVWRRLPTPALPGLGELLEEFRLQALQAALHARRIEETVVRLRRAGVEPLLFKGWAVARLYPEPGTRPFCDIDCLVPAERFARARAVLDPSSAEAAAPATDGEAHSQPLTCGPDAHIVDLHYRLPDLANRTLQELHDRSQLVPLGATTIRVLGPEDQLRLSALHFLRHSGWRPLWLCDLALLLETAGTDFDWDYCLRGPRAERDWLVCVFQLSRQLLGARLDRVPTRYRTSRLPSWLPRTVLKHWGRAFWGSESRPMASYLLAPAGLRQALSHRWADPIAATLRWRLPMTGTTRLPWQIGAYLDRSVRMLGRWIRGFHGHGAAGVVRPN